MRPGPEPNFCDTCGEYHLEYMPHEYGSFTYRQNFFNQHGRLPTYRDAMRHCPPEVRDLAVQAYEAFGLDVDDIVESRAEYEARRERFLRERDDDTP